MDYNNFSHYAKERMASLRGENAKVERWSNFATNLRVKKLMVARLQSFFKNEKKGVARVRRNRRHSRGGS
jgi:hypothetical protein